MTTPGSNIFKRASKLIKLQTIQYYAATGRTPNAARQWVPAFAAAAPLRASVQMVPRSSYADLGLDFNKVYVNIFAAANLVDLQRDTSGDRFIWAGDLYQMQNENSWFVQDGWASALAVRYKQNATGPA